MNSELAHTTSPLLSDSLQRSSASLRRSLFRPLRGLGAFALAMAMVFALVSPVLAKPPMLFSKVVEVNAVSITISLGKAGDVHQTYTIDDKTKVTLDGAPANARDLHPGMQAHVEIGADKKTAKSVVARSPAAHPSRGRVG